MQRPWSGAEPHMPEQQRAACVMKFMMKGKGGEWQAGESRRWDWCPVYLPMSRNVYRSGGETLASGAPPPAGSPREQAPQLSFVPHCFPSTRNSLHHNGL